MYPGPDTFLQYYMGPYLQSRHLKQDVIFVFICQRHFCPHICNDGMQNELNSDSMELDDDELRTSVFCAVPMIDQQCSYGDLMYNSRLLYEGCHDTHITPRLLHLQDPLNITTTTALFDASIYNEGGGHVNGLGLENIIVHQLVFR